MKHHMSTAFTLLELLMVMAIIGILSAVAVPSYQQYITKAKLTELIGIIELYKVKVTEAVMLGELPNIDTADIQTPVLQSLNLYQHASGIYVINAVANDLVSPAGIELKLQYQASLENNLLKWRCYVNHADHYQVVPKECARTEHFIAG